MFNEKQLRNFWAKVDKKDDTECWEWTGSLTRTGYGMVKYNNKNKTSHRISFMIHNNRQIEDKKHILHSCDNGKCCNPHHLREGTHKDNMDDMTERGRRVLPPRKKGEAHHNSKLSGDIVREIRKRFREETITHTQLAKDFGVGRATVSDIIKERTWLHIGE